MNHITQFISYLTSIGLNQKTIKSKEYQLNYYLSWLQTNPLSVTNKTIKCYYQYLFETKSACRIVTLNSYMISLNQFYTWCCDFEYLQAHPFGDFELKKDFIKNTRKPIKLELIKKLYKNTIYPYEKLVLIFGYACGIRTSEILAIKVKDIAFDKALITVQKGKYSKRRSIPLQYKHLEYIKNYIIHKNLPNQAYLFTTPYGQMRDITLQRQLKVIQQRIHLTRPYFTIHHLRHSIASHLLDNGVDIELIQQFLGHSTLKTTQNYVKPNNTIHYGSFKKMGIKASKEDK